mgnify:CR=1 FL=1
MNHAWQQPIRKMTYEHMKEDFGGIVLFIRPLDPTGFEIITQRGFRFTNMDVYLEEDQSS